MFNLWGSTEDPSAESGDDMDRDEAVLESDATRAPSPVTHLQKAKTGKKKGQKKLTKKEAPKKKKKGRKGMFVISSSSSGAEMPSGFQFGGEENLSLASVYSVPAVLVTNGVNNAASTFWQTFETISETVAIVGSHPEQILDEDDIIDSKTSHLPHGLVVDSDIEASLQNMTQPPHVFKAIRVLFLHLLVTLENVRVNSLLSTIAQFRARLFDFIRVIGNPSHSLLQRFQSQDNTDPLPTSAKLWVIEDSLSRAVQYFTRFTFVDAFMHVLAGTDLKVAFERFDSGIAAGLIDLISGLKQEEAKSLFGIPLNPFFRLYVEPSCTYNPHDNLRLETLMSEEIANDPNSTSMPLLSLDEISAVKKYCFDLEQDTARTVYTQRYSIIRQKLLRDIWLEAAVAIQKKAASDKQDHDHAHKHDHDHEGSAVNTSLPTYITLTEFFNATRVIIDREHANPQSYPDVPPIFCIPKHMSEKNPNFKRACVTLLNDLVPQLSKIIDADADGVFGPEKLARITRLIPHQEHRLDAILETLLIYSRAHCTRIMPPLQIAFDDNTLIWDDMLYQNITTSIRNPGWVNLVGSINAGKTVRALAVVHELPLDRDAVWIDFSDALTEIDFYCRISTQLFFTHSVYETVFKENLRKVIKSLRTKDGCPVIVLDSIRNKPVKKDNKKSSKIAMGEPLTPDAAFNLAFAKVVELFKEYETTCCIVVISTHPIGSVEAYCRKITIKPLPLAKAKRLAMILMPNSPNALVRAGRSLAGLMFHLSNRHGMAAISCVAKMTKATASKANAAARHKILGEDLALSLTVDENLCATVLWKGMPAFDEAMGWAMCKHAFGDDIIRWKIAWSGLLSCGWMEYNPDIGYRIPANATVLESNFDEFLRPLEDQWTVYVMYWAGQCIRIHNSFGLTPAYFVQYRPHFMTMFSSFHPHDQLYTREGVAHELQFNDLNRLAHMLAGNISRLAQAAIHPRVSHEITAAIKHHIEATDSVEYLLAVSDHAIEVIRCNEDCEDEIQMLSDLVTVIENEMPDHPAVGHAFAVLGYMLQTKHRFEEAKDALIKALAVWDAYNGRPVAETEMACIETVVDCGNEEDIFSSYYYITTPAEKMYTEQRLGAIRDKIQFDVDQVVPKRSCCVMM